jgi:hypothetical protein
MVLLKTKPTALRRAEQNNRATVELDPIQITCRSALDPVESRS